MSMFDSFLACRQRGFDFCGGLQGASARAPLWPSERTQDEQNALRAVTDEVLLLDGRTLQASGPGDRGDRVGAHV